MATLKQMIKDAQLLSKPDQKRLKTALTAMIDEDEPSSKKSDDANIELFYAELAGFHQRNLRQKLPPLPVFKSGTHGKSLKHCVAAIDEFYKTIKGKTHDRKAYRAKYYNLYISTVAQDLERMNVTANISSLLSAHDRFPAVLDRSFPGYIRSGLLFKMVIANKK